MSVPTAASPSQVNVIPSFVFTSIRSILFLSAVSAVISISSVPAIISTEKPFTLSVFTSVSQKSSSFTLTPPNQVPFGSSNPKSFDLSFSPVIQFCKRTASTFLSECWKLNTSPSLFSLYLSAIVCIVSSSNTMLYSFPFSSLLKISLLGISIGPNNICLSLFAEK